MHSGGSNSTWGIPVEDRPDRAQKMLVFWHWSAFRRTALRTRRILLLLLFGRCRPRADQGSEPNLMELARSVLHLAEDLALQSLGEPCGVVGCERQAEVRKPPLQSRQSCLAVGRERDDGGHVHPMNELIENCVRHRVEQERLLMELSPRRVRLKQIGDKSQPLAKLAGVDPQEISP